jgi:pimeloyl-ACP methyl ester carboxylesterase
VLCTDHLVVDALLTTAASNRRVIAPDLRHGMSTWTTPMPHSRAWLVAFLEALGLESVRLRVDAAYAADAHGVAMIYPELVASVELIGPRAVGSLEGSR